MNKSEQIDQLATAMVKAQGEMRNAKKSADNPFFNSKYADLAEVLDTCRECLSKNGTAVVQPVGAFDGANITITTLLMHSSGQWISSDTVMPVVPNTRFDKVTKEKIVEYNPQVTGSAITYARRYALAAMVGISQDDDDGNGSSGNHENVPAGNKGAGSGSEGAGHTAPAVAPAQDMLCAGCGSKLSSAVFNASVKRFGRPLCFKCQRNK